MDSIITFHTTHGVITGEKALLASGLAAEASGIPPAITAGCGLCLRLPKQQLAQALALLAAHSIDVQGVYTQGNGTYNRIEEEGEPAHAENENGTARGI